VRQNLAMKEQDVRFAMSQIQHAFTRAPDGADTAQGIHQFWLQWTEPAPHWHVTQEALVRLEKLRVVQRVRLEDGREVWRRAGPLANEDPTDTR
jgi:hypothetical protein